MGWGDLEETLGGAEREQGDAAPTRTPAASRLPGHASAPRPALRGPLSTPGPAPQLGRRLLPARGPGLRLGTGAREGLAGPDPHRRVPPHHAAPSRSRSRRLKISSKVAPWRPPGRARGGGQRQAPDPPQQQGEEPLPPLNFRVRFRDAARRSPIGWFKPRVTPRSSPRLAPRAAWGAGGG